MFPDVTDHLIKNNGVTPILEMFDACFSRYERSSASASVSAASGSKSTGSSRDNSSTQSFSSVVLADVLKVINKIMEGSGSSQEQLVTMGIIPQVRFVPRHATGDNRQSRQPFIFLHTLTYPPCPPCPLPPTASQIVRLLEDEAQKILTRFGTTVRGCAAKAVGKAKAKPAPIAPAGGHVRSNSEPTATQTSSSAAPASGPSFTFSSLFPPSFVPPLDHDDVPTSPPTSSGGDTPRRSVSAAALEAARFVHLVASASPLSLQVTPYLGPYLAPI